MNRILFLAILGFSCALIPSSAHAWNKILSCENDGLVVDQQPYFERGQNFIKTQLVIRDPRAVAEFKNKGLFEGYFYNQNNEIIDGAASLGRHDLGAAFAYGTAKRFTEAEYIQKGFAFVLYSLQDMGYGNYKLVFVLGNPYPSQRPEVANWIFRNCQSF